MTNTNPGLVTATELRSQIESERPPILLDVRTFPEFQDVHLLKTRNLPLDEVSAATVEERVGASKTDAIVVICQSGGRAQKAAQRLNEAGFTDLRILEGGTQAWLDAGFDVERGKSKVLPLMRQVQLIAGLLVLTGAVLALTVNPFFALIPAFVGAGLTLAGSTGWCGMALLLAKMPWNRGGGCGSCSE